MNFIRGRIEGDRFVTESGLRLPLATVPQASAGRAAICGVRPEHFRLTSNGIPAEVVVVEPTGTETQVAVKVGGQEVICVWRERIAARPGETIRISPDPTQVHLCDQTSGRRLE
jgi:multiple sugar transport system ATP-binding protein